jgi:hypothetical protein
MERQPTTWEWGSFFVYGGGCFFVGFLAGLLRVPGVIPVVIAAAVGAWAALRAWFESPVIPRSVAAPRRSLPARRS